jgi:hypothetical protein
MRLIKSMLSGKMVFLLHQNLLLIFFANLRSCGVGLKAPFRIKTPAISKAKELVWDLGNYWWRLQFQALNFGQYPNPF